MFRDYLVLGGAGLVGLQVCRRIAAELTPARVVVASLLEQESRDAVERLGREFPLVGFVPVWGNLFIPDDLANTPRAKTMADPVERRRLLEAVYGDFEKAYAENHLVRLIAKSRPEVIVDCVNTAT